MDDQIKLDLPWPVSANQYWMPVGKRLIKTKQARDYITKVTLDWMSARADQGLKPFQNGTELAMAISAHYPKKKGPDMDLDNLTKVLIDALEVAGVYENDNCLRHVQITRECGVPEGLVRVYLRPVKAGLHLDKTSLKVLGVHEYCE